MKKRPRQSDVVNLIHAAEVIGGVCRELIKSTAQMTEGRVVFPIVTRRRQRLDPRLHMIGSTP